MKMYRDYPLEESGGLSKGNVLHVDGKKLRILTVISHGVHHQDPVSSEAVEGYYQGDVADAREFMRWHLDVEEVS